VICIANDGNVRWNATVTNGRSRLVCKPTGSATVTHLIGISTSVESWISSDVALPNEDSSILEEIQRYRKNDNTIDLYTKFVHDPRPTWVPLVDLFERHPRAVDNFMREVGLDLQDYLPEVALSGSEESINPLEEEEDNDTEDADEDGDISQENEFSDPSSTH
jgi:hypothetical protein